MKEIDLATMNGVHRYATPAALERVQVAGIGRLVFPESGIGRYSLPNAVKRKKEAERPLPHDMPDLSTKTAREQWNSSNRAPYRR